MRNLLHAPKGDCDNLKNLQNMKKREKKNKKGVGVGRGHYVRKGDMSDKGGSTCISQEYSVFEMSGTK